MVRRTVLTVLAALGVLASVATPANASCGSEVRAFAFEDRQADTAVYFWGGLRLVQFRTSDQEWLIHENAQMSITRERALVTARSDTSTVVIRANLRRGQAQATAIVRSRPGSVGTSQSATLSERSRESSVRAPTAELTRRVYKLNVVRGPSQSFECLARTGSSR